MTDGTIRILLADDHAMVREGLAALVAKDPAIEVVGQCGDGLKVLELVEQTRPDVLVLDITMPGLNGVDVCRELTRKAKKRTPAPVDPSGGLGATPAPRQVPAVLILTMHDDEQFVSRTLANGAAGYLLKEAAGDQLCDAIKRVAKGERYLGPGTPAAALREPGAAGGDPYDSLTSRERQVLQLVAEGLTNREVAEELKLALKTVDTHRTRLMRKLHIHDQTSLVKFAIRRGIVGCGRNRRE